MTRANTILSVSAVAKTYHSGQSALHDVSLDIAAGEILALLGPNGAGKTTLISIICGLVEPTAGRVTVAGHDIKRDYRAARQLIGLVPQELTLDPFARVIDTMRYSRGLFGLRSNEPYLESLLKTLTLWDKKDTITKELSGGMKRRCLIAKALAHEPRILFLDEPTAGVDVELRKDMWALVARLKSEGVTTILTTHYIEEAEAIADRVGVISDGTLILVEEKAALMRRLGRRRMRLTLKTPLSVVVPETLARRGVARDDDGALIYTYRQTQEDGAGPNKDEAVGGVGEVLRDLAATGAVIRDIETTQRSLEEIFVELVGNGSNAK